MHKKLLKNNCLSPWRSQSTQKVRNFNGIRGMSLSLAYRHKARKFLYRCFGSDDELKRLFSCRLQGCEKTRSNDTSLFTPGRATACDYTHQSTKYQIYHYSRRFESSKQGPKTVDDVDDHITLYERNSSHNKFPRGALALSLVNTIYWSWYTIDFIPAINASPIEALHVDPRVGLFGVGLGLAINFVTILYPISLVSKLTVTTNTQKLNVWMHDLPFLRPSSKFIEYPIGSLTLNPASSDTKKILNEMDGDLRQYRGHLAVSVKEKSFPLLIEIRQKENIINSDTMFQVLLNAKEFSLRTAAAAKKTKTRGNVNKTAKNRRGRGRRR